MTRNPWTPLGPMTKPARAATAVAGAALVAGAVWVAVVVVVSGEGDWLLKALTLLASTVVSLIGFYLALYGLRLTRRQNAQTEANQARGRADGRRDRAVDLLSSTDPDRRRDAFAELDLIGKQDPEQRQYIVDQIRTYLRKPFTMPQDCTTPASREQARRELEVRACAQKILTDNLRDPAREADCEWHLDPVAEPWDVKLDLSGTILINIAFLGCRMKLANFAGTEFRGTCGFDHSVFEGPATFEDALFDETAGFQSVEFLDTVLFWRTHFGDFAWFSLVLCHKQISFSGAYFDGMAQLGNLRLAKRVSRFAAIASVFAHVFGAATDQPRQRRRVTGFIDFGGVTVQKPGQFNSWPEGWQELLAADGTATVARVPEQQAEATAEEPMEAQG